MIHSVQDDNKSSWNDLSHSSLDNAFTSLSMSDVSSERSRPPALSMSSISSIGEEMSSRGVDYSNCTYYGSHPPSSPASHSSRSHLMAKSTLNSPIGAVSRHSSTEYGNTTPTQHYDGANNVNNVGQFLNKNYASFDGAGYSSAKSLPTFQELDEDLNSSGSGYSHGGGGGSARSLQDSDRIISSHDQFNYSNIHNNSSDLSETNNCNPAFGNWSQSSNNMNTRSTHSLCNMGSVDENEQFLGNRARALSATASLGYQRPNSYTSGVTGVTSYHGDENLNCTSASASASAHGLGGSTNYLTTRSIPVSRTFADDGSMHTNRQRVMSADAVHNPSLRNHGIYDSQGPRLVTNSSSQLNSEHYAYNNRPRSFSSGTTNFVSSPNFRRVSPQISDFAGSMPQTQNQSYPNKNMHQHHIDGSSMHGMMPPIMDHQYPNHHSNQTGARTYMHERYLMHDTGYTNQDRMIRMQQSYGSSDSLSYYPQKIQSTPRTVYTVKFKRSQKNFFLNEHIQGDIKIGSYVKVEADRGEDLGIVLSRIPIEKFNPGARLNSPNLDIPDLQLKRITRLASDSEIAHLGLKEEEEAELLKICRSKTLQRGLPMNVVDAEYQFDRHKLTFFFEANCRVDFRELVRDLFSIYKTRIWMQQIDKVPGNSHSLNSSLVADPENYRFDGSITNSSESLPTYGVVALAANAGVESQTPHGGGG